MSPDTFHGEIFSDRLGNERQGKILKTEKKRRKFVKEKVENLKRKGKKYENEQMTPFFFLFTFLNH